MGTDLAAPDERRDARRRRRHRLARHQHRLILECPVPVLGGRLHRSLRFTPRHHAHPIVQDSRTRLLYSQSEPTVSHFCRGRGAVGFDASTAIRYASPSTGRDAASARRSSVSESSLIDPPTMIAVLLSDSPTAANASCMRGTGPDPRPPVARPIARALHSTPSTTSVRSGRSVSGPVALPPASSDSRTGVGRIRPSSPPPAG